MKKLTTFLLSGVLLFGAVACSNAKTSADAPNSTQEAVQTPKAEEAQTTKNDAQSETRRKQLNADIKAREERNNALNAGSPENRSDNDLESQVRSKLEANIPQGQLTVKSEKGVVTVAGTVPKQEQLAKIKTEALKIKGVKSVNVTAKVAAPK
jgi:hyperosmotically inducible periplasmic protein